MATYNRSKVIYYSIMSVLSQTYQNWELIVVGDCCTDDTEDVVSSFNDPRIIFHNLPENFGEQSYPNNVGMKLSTGDYIAFLNHDDIWLPDHLELSLKKLKTENADFVFSIIGMIGDFKENTLIAYSESGNFEYHVIVPASSWLFKREVYLKVGDWRSAWDIIQYPSEDYLYRVLKSNFKIKAVNKLTLIKPASTYIEKTYFIDSDINKTIYQSIINNPNFREDFLTSAIINNYGEYSIKVHLYKLIREIIKRFSIFFAKIFKLHPHTITNIIAYRGGKGKGINQLRKIRGLESKKK